ncbi:MAG: DUF2807 domain-containing protein [Bacteroidetes bacterium]|nr:DUF2807 domain-containing protein [Bacteroidota bacterium]MBU1719151.1 DUF2807 domain-containing protein [Bacteroidota bacterium]
MIKKKRVFGIILLCGGFILSSCDSFFCSKSNSEIIEKKFETGSSSFFCLDAENTVVTLRHTNQNQILLSGTRNALSVIQTITDNGTLTITDRACPGTHKKVDAQTYMQNITDIVNKRNGIITSADEIETNSLSVENQRDGRITLESLNIQNLTIEVQGSGNAEFAGKSKVANISIKGSGSCNAASLSVKSAAVNISGDGSCRISVSEALNVELSGSGNVYYKGNPAISSSVTGTGRLIQLD